MDNVTKHLFQKKNKRNNNNEQKAKGILAEKKKKKPCGIKLVFILMDGKLEWSNS